MIDQHLSNLGMRATDKVTGKTGTVTSVCFDLYGCIQVILTPPVTATDQEMGWYDISRMEFHDTRAMDAPDYGYTHSAPAVAAGHKGGYSKPLP